MNVLVVSQYINPDYFEILKRVFDVLRISMR